MLTLYGQAKSRASRSLWMLEEIGVEYRHVPVRPYTQSRTPDYLRINPNGRIPSLDDDGFILWESLAINLYLAQKYAAAPLWPGALQDRALAYQWSFWAANEIEPRIVAIAGALARQTQDQAAVASPLAELASALRVLEQHLGERTHLLGSDFTVADVNLASHLREPGEHGVANIAAIDLTPFPNLARWLDGCAERAAVQRVAALP